MIIITHRPNSISNHLHPILSVGAHMYTDTHQEEYKEFTHIKGVCRHSYTHTHTYGWSKCHGRRDRIVGVSYYYCRFMQSSQTEIVLVSLCLYLSTFTHCLYVCLPFIYIMSPFSHQLCSVLPYAILTFSSILLSLICFSLSLSQVYIDIYERER